VNSHELKCWPEYFQATWNGKKFFEVRRNDRDFQVGDEIVLREFNPMGEGFFGERSIAGIITYVTDFHQEPGFIVLGFRETERFPRNRLTPR